MQVWKHKTQKVAKNRHLGTIAQLCRAISSQLRHISTIGKKIAKQQYLLHMFPQYGELWPTSGWDRSGSLRHPSKFERVSRLGSVTARHSSSGRQPNFATLHRGRHLYSAGRPSRWALVNIQVKAINFSWRPRRCFICFTYFLYTTLGIAQWKPTRCYSLSLCTNYIA